MISKSHLRRGEFQNKNNIDIARISNSQKENTWAPIVNIKIRDEHNLDMIKRIVEKKNPNIIVLRSTKPSFNNKTINYLQFFVSKGWKVINTKPLKREVNRKYTNTISFMLSSPFLHSLKPDETHPEKGCMADDGEGGK